MVAASMQYESGVGGTAVTEVGLHGSGLSHHPELRYQLGWRVMELEFTGSSILGGWFHRSAQKTEFVALGVGEYVPGFLAGLSHVGLSGTELQETQ